MAVKVVALLGTRAAEIILASGHVRPHTKAAHMEASDPIKYLQKTLASGGRPHMGRRTGHVSRCQFETILIAEMSALA